MKNNLHLFGCRGMFQGRRKLLLVLLALLPFMVHLSSLNLVHLDRFVSTRSRLNQEMSTVSHDTQ